MNDTLRNRLLEQQPINEEAEKRFRMEVCRMTEKKLTFIGRASWVFVGLLGLFFVALFGYKSWSMPTEFPLLVRLVFVGGAVFGAAWVWIAVHILKKGSLNLKTDENTVHALTWLIMVFMMTAFLFIGGQMENRVLGISIVLYGLVFFVVFAIPAFINLRVNRLELGIREQLLRMEITLAENATNQDPCGVGGQPGSSVVQEENEPANKNDSCDVGMK